MAFQGSAEEKRQRAQSLFDKSEKRKVEVAKSGNDHRTSISADAAKTIRLRALRLAKEEADTLAAKAQEIEKQATVAALPRAERKKPVRREAS